MDIDYLIVVLLGSVTAAAMLLIATVGLAIVFGLMGVVNLAHGEFIMIGAYTTLTVTRAGVPFVVAIFAGAALTAVFSIVVEIMPGDGAVMKASVKTPPFTQRLSLSISSTRGDVSR